MSKIKAQSDYQSQTSNFICLIINVLNVIIGIPFIVNNISKYLILFTLSGIFIF